MNNLAKRLLTSAVLIAGFLIIFFILPPLACSLALVAILAHVLRFEWPLICARNRALWLITPAYPILPFILLIKLNHTHHSFLFLLIASVAAFDSGAYFAGKLFGTHKLAPTISPGKTWEGVAGGYAASALVCLLFLSWFKQPYTHATLIGFTTGICVCALLGDLFESWLKRKAGIKDTGSILPGHGGFLDRMDGLLIAVFFVYLVSLLLFLPSVRI